MDNIKIIAAFVEAERRFKELMDNANLVAVMLDEKGTLTYCNDYFCKLTGFTREDVLQKSWFENFLPSEIAPTLQERFRRDLREGNIFLHHENEILTREGKHRLIAWNNTLLRDLQGSPSGAASIGVDITEQRQRETALDQSTKAFQSQLQIS